MPIFSGGGGGSSYAPPTARTQYGKTNTTVNNGVTFAPLAWGARNGGTTDLLNLTVPTLPTVLTGGIYSVTLIAAATTAMTAGGWISTSLEMDQANDDAQLTINSALASASLAGPACLVTMTYYVPAGGIIAVSLSNVDGVQNLAFSFVAMVQRLT